ncbi:homoserine kinase [Sandaracinobacteroides saxicola]|uniref:Homoserine kinase n=1 Tax=Sandaracinobacteroides saxicola TaxID=2759707 RepID=A0A7G5IJY2_9SPHN|nr:homoserine kinase [Sandaracinobacteroides saxicola]QMW23674.1 homoserine kinase [Sandaracinobacteroides saxicola]
MAVYTQVSAEALADFLTAYDVGDLVAAKGIAEGVSNSNYLVETTRGRFILTLYEARTRAEDLPWFVALMRHLADAGLPVARPVAARDGGALRRLCGRDACLIEFLPGVSLSTPTEAQAAAVAAAMAVMHRAGEGFAPPRANELGQAAWRGMAEAMGPRLETISPGLRARVMAEVTALEAAWPHALPGGVIHADLFPDNVLMLGGRVTGLIDFYFACNDLRAYDLAVMETAWAFDAADRFLPGHAAALRAGYGGLNDAELAAMPVLARGACLRFLLSRAQDWLDTPASALVTRKDPLSYLRRLEHYAS